jgi:hypothetical protein
MGLNKQQAQAHLQLFNPVARFEIRKSLKQLMNKGYRCCLQGIDFSDIDCICEELKFIAL